LWQSLKGANEVDPIESIGKKLRGDEQRDAIHIAIMPVVSGEDYLSAGDEVALVYGTKNVVKRKDSTYGHQTLGVIDPFFGMGPNVDYEARTIHKGDTVWCFLRPGTITGLRHEWTRPDIDNQPQPSSESEKWLRAFADRWMFDYDEMIGVASLGVIKSNFDIPALPEMNGREFDQDWITARGRDLHSRDELGEDYDLFWSHMQKLTGQTFSAEHREKVKWSCTC
jgi:hypothetical protein